MAKRNRFETVLKPVKRGARVRTKIDEIANAEEATAVRIEVEGDQRALKRAETPMHVADDEVAPARVRMEVRHPRRDGGLRARGRRKTSGRNRRESPNEPRRRSAPTPP